MEEPVGTESSEDEIDADSTEQDVGSEDVDEITETNEEITAIDESRRRASVRTRKDETPCRYGGRSLRMERRRRETGRRKSSSLFRRLCRRTCRQDIPGKGISNDGDRHRRYSDVPGFRNIPVPVLYNKAEPFVDVEPIGYI